MAGTKHANFGQPMRKPPPDVERVDDEHLTQGRSPKRVAAQRQAFADGMPWLAGAVAMFIIAGIAWTWQ